MDDWKYRTEFYQVKDSCLDKPKKWVNMGADLMMNSHNRGINFEIYKCSLGNGLFLERTFAVNAMELVSLPKEEMDEINNEFSRPLERMTQEKLIDCALMILDIYPTLSSSTCLGWQPYEDKTKDPNWRGGHYIFPDNNTYLVILHKGVLRVYPGKGDIFSTWVCSEPLAETEINIQEWVNKAYSKNE